LSTIQIPSHKSNGHKSNHTTAHTPSAHLYCETPVLQIFTC
jgi:hypothetical protein